MARVDIYTARSCPYCQAAKALLARRGVPFNEIDISGNWERRDEMIARANGKVTVPQIFVGTRHLGDHHDLVALERDGRLDAVLAQAGGGA